jgi:manganese/iron transport system substrate-binding protein
MPQNHRLARRFLSSPIGWLAAWGAMGLTACSTPSSVTPSSASPTGSSIALESGSQGNRPLVIATTSVVCDLTRQIAADTVNLKCLVAPGADPHEYEAKPEDIKALEQAKLILYSGYNFETHLLKLIKSSANPAPKMAVNELGVPNPEQFEEDGKTVPDPHVFHSAMNGVKTAAVISQNLTQLLPDNAKMYASNSKKLTDELTQIDAWIKSEIVTIPAAQRQLVTTHDAFGYYSKAYGLPVIGALQGISTEEKPTPTRVKDLVQGIKSAGVPTIFAEATVNPKLIEAVAKESNVKVSDKALFADGLGEPGSEGDTYQKMLMANTKAIVEGLGGKYTPFQLKTSSRPPLNDRFAMRP